MAEDTIDHAAPVANLDDKPSVTVNLPIHGYHNKPEKFGDLAIYGSDAQFIKDMLLTHPEYEEKLHPNFKTITGEVVWAVRNEMGRTVEDFLARRTRALLLDAKASMEMAPQVARLMAKELDRDDAWIDKQITDYRKLAREYLII
jgi:glycerol-3-phosphate dehydrogenase